ncbi:g7090 [Coccomyxa viridis]|uniref:G7090 protein n=1 Tax=Coccomyxa viridis TaxID=1274662 RepID=A0ABP1FWZ3_9CHLO
MVSGVAQDLSVSASAASNASNELEYPDPANFNLNDTHEQLVFMHKYEDAQQHDPSVKYAVVIFYLILLTVIAAQSGLVMWKKRHKRSYELATLMGLWLVPAIISVYFHFWRFVGVWAIFSGVTGYILYTCTLKRIEKTTPRRVYSYFLGVYKVSVAVGLAGYALLILEACGMGPFLRKALEPAAAFMLLWYGLYFGVLGRDCAEVAADRMAATIGMRKRMAVSTRACGICSGELRDFGSVVSASEEVRAGQNGLGSAGQAKLWGAESTVQLECKHCFHDQCIRGWTIVGKKDTCPVCLEKVDLRKIFSGRPWETRNLMWMQMLDSLRYLIVWNPLILICLHFLLHYVGFDKFAKHKGDREALAIMSNATLLHIYEEEEATQQGLNLTYSLRL